MRLYKLSRINMDRISDIGNVVTAVVIAKNERDARVLAAGGGIDFDARFLSPEEVTCQPISMTHSQIVSEEMYSRE